ncbi:MAG: 50S ribosomal protein L22 [Alphaproteobacteria bacterium]|nr:50S ribosomal protein L22 [Alphaproteobacteria bacterium]OJV16381.1 MAG: 50S ribosomal protein L22 [Alphaproteobacteria bacterium 33-17]
MKKSSIKTASAKISALRISPIKLNLVAGMIRGKKANAALVDLEFSKKRIAIDVRKCLLSAVANAENNLGMDIDRLHVARVEVGKSFVMKRFSARARGRSARIEKFFSNITIHLQEI